MTAHHDFFLMRSAVRNPSMLRDFIRFEAQMTLGQITGKQKYDEVFIVRWSYEDEKINSCMHFNCFNDAASYAHNILDFKDSHSFFIISCLPGETI